VVLGAVDENPLALNMVEMCVDPSLLVFVDQHEKYIVLHRDSFITMFLSDCGLVSVTSLAHSKRNSPSILLLTARAKCESQK
jgi:hypothetical protein